MDLYIVLGVERGAPPGEIKKAYRRLARRLHPDINPGDREAEARFRQILAAYETLMDPERRQRYDAGQLSAAGDQGAGSFGFAGFDFSTGVHAEKTTTFGELFEDIIARRAGRHAPRGVEQGADIHARAVLGFEEAWQGVERSVLVNRLDACQECSGSGLLRVADTICASCDGTGMVRSVRGHMVFSRNCSHCGGAGRLKQESCATCRGQGVVPRAEVLSVRIPPGTDDGGRVRVAGKGHAGVHGGPPGNLIIDVEVGAHPAFRRDGDDVHMSVPIAVHEAALGAKIEITTPDGPARLRVPPGTQSGQRLRLRERGAPGRSGRRGDLVVEVRLTLPKVLDERSKDLLREFGRINGENVRAS